jgi:hypothetical protein
VGERARERAVEGSGQELTADERAEAIAAGGEADVAQVDMLADELREREPKGAG